MPGVWTILVPLKPLAGAKSRLRGALPDIPHEELVLALAHATVTATAASTAVGRVIVISNDPFAGFETFPDRHDELNGALRDAAAQVRGPVAAMPADLPALRTEELTQALAQAVTHSFVPDTEGTGTVLLAAPEGPLDPRFGQGSARAHELSGARRLVGDWPTLRRDVDTAGDLAEAIRLGWQYPLITGMTVLNPFEWPVG